MWRLAQQLWQVLNRTDVAQRHVQELLARIAIVLNCGIVHVKKGKRFPVEDPHGTRILGEWYAQDFGLCYRLGSHVSSSHARVLALLSGKAAWNDTEVYLQPSASTTPSTAHRTLAQ